MRRQRGDPDARAEVEGRALRQRHGLPRRQRDELLRGAVGAVPGDLPEPDPFADASRLDVGPHRHDVPEPSWFGTTSGKASGCPGPPPRRTFQSVGFTPEIATRTSTSPGPGAGSGRSTSDNTLGSPVSRYTIALMLPS